MAKNTLYNKIWDSHVVTKLPTGQAQLFVGLHLIHEVTSPQAFDMMREQKLKVAFPQRTFATIDHIVPTVDQSRPYKDGEAEAMMRAIEKNAAEFGVTLLDFKSTRQGVVHIVGPELGLTQPGMTIACGDSHTATHGAFGALAFGVGTSQVRDVLATQCLGLDPFKVRRVEVNGTLNKGVTAKDVILYLIRKLGVNGGIGYAYEFGGTCFDAMSMEARMTVCNMAIEGGARIGYVNPDETTFAYLKGKDYAPKGAAWDKALAYWRSVASDKDAAYDDVARFKAEDIEPMVTWGITPAQSVAVNEALPRVEDFPAAEQGSARQAFAYMGLKPGQKMTEVPVDVVFIGSCTNGRIEDLRAAAALLKGRHKAPSVSAIAVPGCMRVRAQAMAEGLDKVFEAAGFEWRLAGCSMCLAMNPDKLKGSQVSASTSNRNFMGRQGSSSGRTLLVSPIMAAAAAIEGRITDVRKFL